MLACKAMQQLCFYFGVKAKLISARCKLFWGEGVNNVPTYIGEYYVVEMMLFEQALILQHMSEIAGSFLSQQSSKYLVASSYKCKAWLVQEKRGFVIHGCE